jgi:AGZA family xanthine/uracil permease-like MFS transporter
MLGTSTTTTYVESAAGVSQGGRTGLTAFVVGCCFAVSLFFSPLFLSIPSSATAPVLIIVGLLMIEPIRNIDFSDYTESIPAFICIIIMPLSYSISDGILLGLIFYVLLNMLCGKFKKITITMYVLATLFILKYIFIVAEPKVVETPDNISPTDDATIQSIEDISTEAEDVIPFAMEESNDNADITE